MSAMERTAQVEHLQEHGCSVLCLDCPEGILFGIDYSAWTVGPKFMGVKLVPQGMHYIYTSGSGEDVGVSRTGFFLLMKPREVAVFRWDPATEELVRPENQDEVSRYTDGVRSFDFDSNLGPYPLGLAAEWAELTSHTTEGLLWKIEPLGKTVHSKRAEYDALLGKQGQEQEQEDDAEGTDGEERAQAASAEQAQPVEGQRQADAPLESNMGGGHFFFSQVPRNRKKKGLTPMETTMLHFDRSAQLEQMITKEYNNEELNILGELQFAFIAFLLGQNFDGFQQWRELLRLLCSCEAAVANRPVLFIELCRVFYTQLSQAPADLFGDDLTKDNFMGSCSLSMLELCSSEGATPKLRKRAAKLRELVEQKFGISAEDLALLGEDAPQIVDLEGTGFVSLNTEAAGDAAGATGPELMALD